MILTSPPNHFHGRSSILNQGATRPGAVSPLLYSRRVWKIDVRKLGRKVRCSVQRQKGECLTAVEELDLLEQQGYQPDVSTFYDALRRCISQKNLVLGSRVHALAVKSGYESNAFLANHIICMYASHGRLEEAASAFAKVATPNLYMWASIILAHARHGQPLEALKLYGRMLESGVQPNNHIYVAVLKACSAAKDFSAGRKVHADILQNARTLDIFVWNCLVDMYCKCGSLEDARRVFNNVPRKDVVTWTAMIAGYAQHGLCQEALALHEKMQLVGLIPSNSVTFLSLLRACVSVGALHQGKKVHAQIQERGLEADVVVGTCLVDMYAKCGSLEDARRVFENLPMRNVVTWNSMIAGYAQHGRGREALNLYAEMQEQGTAAANRVTFVCLLQACAGIGALHEGKQLHALICAKGLEAQVGIGNCLVNMYAKCGNLEDARRLFENLPTRDVVTWNAMIAGYVQHGVGQEALALYGCMQIECITLADNVTFVCLLQACASVGALCQGKQLHAKILERGLEPDVVVGNSLVDMYAKCGSMDHALRVFDRLPTKNVVTWSALLNGYAEHGDGLLAMQCFRDMCQQGIKPDAAAFVCLLVACSHAGLVHEGQTYFTTMVEDHCIIPTVEHFNCMVDLLGRSGHLNEAESLLLSMPFDSDAVGWTSLLSACKSHGDVSLGERCFHRLVELEPKNAGAHVLLANIYANSGRWKEVRQVEALRKSASAFKKAAKAYIEVQNQVHVFTVGEEGSHTSSKVRSFNLRLKERGHVPETKLVLKPAPEHEKEDSLCGHAEKLALAYGLLNTVDGTPLLVTKNLRMCNDCHSSTKIMSQLEKREIIVKDVHRVHHFVDGSCSCSDRH